MAENKIQFGLKNVHYAVWNADTSTYGDPVAIPGAVSLTLSPEGDTNKFYADNLAYFVTSTNNGYSGDLEVARIPDSMLVDVLGYTLDSTSKVIAEKSDAIGKTFALLYQVEGDQQASCFVLYACTAARPDMGSETKSESTEPKTQTISITAVPKADGKVSARTTAETSSTVVSGWFNAVYTG